MACVCVRTYLPLLCRAFPPPTGLSNVDEIVEKFLSRDEKTRQLEKNAEDVRKKTEELRKINAGDCGLIWGRWGMRVTQVVGVLSRLGNRPTSSGRNSRKCARTVRRPPATVTSTQRRTSMSKSFRSQ